MKSQFTEKIAYNIETMVKKENILPLFREKTTKPLSYKELVSLMRISRAEARALKKTLRLLVQEGSLIRTRRGLYGLPDDMNLINGFFEQHREGYGFVIPEKPGERDIFISSRASMGAMNNDRVIARIENWRKREGRILRIVERAHTRIVGTFEATSTGFYIKPKDKTIQFDFSVSRKDTGDAHHGDTVIAEITGYPSDRKFPSARITKILEKPSEPRDEIEAIIDEFNLQRKFPRNVLEEARRFSLQHQDMKREQVRRRDLRGLPTVTIDGERAKDFDDAVSIQLAKNGYTLFVHIADVSHYVRMNSSTDMEARRRATSVYFPDRVIPMLPRELSEDICSLKPQVERFTITAEMSFDRDGNRTVAHFYPSIIFSNERMTYTSVNKILTDSDQHERLKYGYLLNDFELMGELCSILRQKRMKRGSLDFDLPEPEVLLDLKGHPEKIICAERNAAHMLIEEFMLAANEAVAGHLSSLDIPMIYRVHEEPDRIKVDEALKAIRTLLPGRTAGKVTNFSSLLRTIKCAPEEEIVHFLILRSLKQARYSHINAGHFGLASDCYTHFTSPIRRYPDLVIHRILKASLQAKRPSAKECADWEKILPDIAFHASRTERSAEKAETAAIDAMRAWFMQDKIGQCFEARIIHVSPYGFKIRLRDYYVEGFIHVSYLTDDFYQYSDRTLNLVGRHTRRSLSLGDDISVRLERVNIEERELLFDIIDH